MRRKIITISTLTVFFLIVLLCILGWLCPSNFEEPVPDGFTGQFVTLPSATIRYTRLGHGPELLLIHGCPGSIEDWEPLVHSLKKDYTITIFDRPGQGFSSPAKGGGSPFEQNVRVVNELIDHFHLDSVVLIGHSYGAVVAVAVAASGDSRIRAVVPMAGPYFGLKPADITIRLGGIPLMGKGLAFLLSPVLGGDKIKKGIESAFAPHQQMIPAGFVELRKRMWTHPSIAYTLSRERVTLQKAAAGISKKYHSLRIPLFIYHGSSDATVQVSQSKRLAEAAPNAVLHILQGQGHYLQFTGTGEILGTLTTELQSLGHAQ